MRVVMMSGFALTDASPPIGPPGQHRGAHGDHVRAGARAAVGGGRERARAAQLLRPRPRLSRRADDQGEGGPPLSFLAPHEIIFFFYLHVSRGEGTIKGKVIVPRVSALCPHSRPCSFFMLRPRPRLPRREDGQREGGWATLWLPTTPLRGRSFPPSPPSPPPFFPLSRIYRAHLNLES